MQTDPYQVKNLYGLNLDVAFQATRRLGQELGNSSTPLPEPLSSFNESATLLRDAGQGKVHKKATKVARLVDRLDALLMVLKTCIGRQCTHPWQTLFPKGEVEDLADALHPQFDQYFESAVDKVGFDKCEKGYIAESEGPMWNGKQVYGMVDEMSFE